MDAIRINDDGSARLVERRYCPIFMQVREHTVATITTIGELKLAIEGKLFPAEDE